MIAPADLNVLLVQARLAWKNPAENRAHLQSLLEAELTADQPPVHLAVFPETFTTGFLGDPDLPPEDMHGPTVAWMRESAQRFDITLAGSAVIVEAGKRFNRFLLVTPDGRVQQYDKRHLFAYGGENKRYVAGSLRTVMTMDEWRVCPQVCYDLRFPAWCRQRGDYDLLLFVANWPGSRIDHWTALLQARAIENQAFVIGLNRVGKDGNGIEYPGRSQVYDPSGKSLVDLEAQEVCRRVSLQLGKVAEVQKAFPFQADADPFELVASS